MLRRGYGDELSARLARLARARHSRETRRQNSARSVLNMPSPTTDQQALPVTPANWHRDAIAASLARFRRVALHRPDLKPASVVVCVMTPPSGHALLITRRAAALRRHAGQWALPGGRRDHGESVQVTALRELHEETGLVVQRRAVLGVLDDVVTRSGYLITPVVVWGGYPGHDLSGPVSEVAEIHQIPLADLDVEPEILSIAETDAPVIRLPLLDGYVHAPTAAIIYQFCQAALHGRQQRVAQFEAPPRLWR
jgi:8-oxo-dGTP pyrophosphatase MutT (NUDIX family)